VTEAEIYAGLTEVFHDAFGDDSIVLKPDMTAEDVEGWDSVKMVAIIIAVEERFGVKMRSREIDQLKCVGDFVKLIGSKLG